jgi:hypothetical protein
MIEHDLTLAKLKKEATRIRKEARLSPFWKENIEALLESNNRLFLGPISYEYMEQCYERIMDDYDPNKIFKDDVKEKDLSTYLMLQADTINPFFSLIELDDQRQVSNVMLWETEDREMIGALLSQKYKRVK